MWRKGNPCALLLVMKIGTSSKENSVKGPQKIKNGTTFMTQLFHFWKPKTLI